MRLGAGPVGRRWGIIVPMGCRRTIGGVLTALSLASAPAALAAGPFDRQPDPAELVSMRLTLQESALTPGATTMLAVVFDIEPGWHLYWKNPGDTGMPIALRSIETPPGVEVEKVFWPAPERYAHTGLVDYIYEDQAVLLLRLRTSPAAKPDQGEIRVRAEWLVCREACLPGSGSADMPVRILPVGGVPKWNRADSRVFESALARLPMPPEVDPKAGVAAAWDGHTLVLTAKGADRLTWFPDEPYDAPPADALRDGSGAGGTLRVAYDDRARDFTRFTGVLAVERDGRTRWYTIETTGPGGASPVGP